MNIFEIIKKIQRIIKHTEPNESLQGGSLVKIKLSMNHARHLIFIKIRQERLLRPQNFFGSPNAIEKGVENWSVKKLQDLFPLILTFMTEVL